MRIEKKFYGIVFRERVLRMRCPYCANADSKVIDSRSADEGNAIRRRRECAACGKRFTTYETIEQVPLMVIKRDGRRVLFDRGKILNGVMRSCEKRSISAERISGLVDEIEKELRGGLEREVSTEAVGELVMRRLKDFDEVAYVRFASVYRKFADIYTFKKELEALLAAKRKEAPEERETEKHAGEN